MLLTSSLESDGPKSTQHYIVLHNNGQRKLVKLPKSYSDLEQKVKTVFYVEPGSYHLETDELNICKGERVMVLGEDWDDVAELLGNVHIVPVKTEPLDVHPESFPDAQKGTTAVFTNDQATVDLASPLVKEEYLVIDIGIIEFEVESTSTTKFNVQVLDESKTAVVTISIFPKTGWLFFTSSGNDTTITLPMRKLFPLDSGHSLILHEKDNNFMLLCDFGLVASVQAPTHSPLTAIQYNLGVQSPFKGPISAKLHPGLQDLREGSSVYQSTYGAIDKETLYHQILSCLPGGEPLVRKALETIRKESLSFQHSSSAIKWKGSRPLLDQWEKMDWNLQSHSVLVIRFDVPRDAQAQTIYVHFGPSRPSKSLRVEMAASEVKFGEYDQNNTCNIKPIPNLPFSMVSPGQHSVTFINRADSLHIIFDFSKSVILPNATINARAPKEMYLQWPKTFSTEVDVYEFR